MVRRAVALLLFSGLISSALPGGAGLSPAAAATPARVQASPAEPAGQKTTPFSQTVRNADGSFTLTSFVSPAFARDARGGWRKANADVGDTGNDAAPLAAAAAYRPVTFGSDPAQLVRLDLEQGPVVLSARGFAKVKPGKSGKKVKYKAVAKDTDLDFGVGPAGFSDEVTLLSDRAARSFTYHLSDPTGQLGSPQPQPGGGFRFDRPDKDGVYLRLGRAWAYEKPVGDAVPDYDLNSAKITVVRTGDGFDITKSVNESWLAGKSFPVVLDPAMYFVGANSSSDCWLQNATHATTPMCFNSLVVGTNVNELARSTIRFPMPGITGTGATIRSANLTLQQTGNVCACGHTLVLSSVAPGNRSWQWNNNASWTRYDQNDPNGAWSGVGLPDGAGPVAGRDIATLQIGATSTNVQRDINTPALVSTVQSWANNSATEHGLHLRGTEVASGTRYLKFDASEQSFGPQLRVDYVARPDQPTVTGVSADDRQLRLTFNGSANATAAEVSSYIAIARRSDGAEFTGSCANGSCTIGDESPGNLDNGTDYTVRVRANGALSSTDSAAAGPYRPFGAPFPVGDLAADATPAAAAARLGFSPAGTNGRPIDGYTINVFDRSGGGRAPVTGFTSSAVGCASKVCYDVQGLRNDNPYSFTVVANAAGRSSSESNEAYATPYDVPGAVAGLSVARGDRSATVKWTDAAAANGSPITGYLVRLVDPAGREVNRTTAPSGERSVTFSTVAPSGDRLLNGVDYRFTVQAMNQRPPGGPIGEAGPARPATLPDTPASVTARAETGKVTVTWDTAAYGSRMTTSTGGTGLLGPGSGGEPVTGYRVALARDNGDGTTTEVTARTPGYDTPQPQVFTGPDVVDGTRYVGIVAAMNTIGSSGGRVSGAVTPLRPVVVAKSVAPAQPSTADGDAVVYTLKLTNPNSSATAVTVTDSPGAGLRVPRTRDGKTPDLALCRNGGATCTLAQVRDAAGLSSDTLTIAVSKLAPGTTTITYPAQPDPGQGASTCALLANSAAARTDALGDTPPSTSSATTLGCEAGLGLEPWWTFRQVPVGPQAMLSVNAGNGNAVVQALDTTPVQAHGRLSYTLRRTYNSAARTAATLPGSIGAGWNFNFGESDDAGLSAGSSLRVPSLGDAADTITHPLALTLVDRDGTRHAFTPRAVNLTTPAASLTGPRSSLKPLALSGATCLDAAYDAPAGVHLGLFRFVRAGDGACGQTRSDGAPGLLSGTPAVKTVVAGYVAVRPDRLRAEYDALGRLVSVVDAAGVELRHLYAGPADPAKPRDPGRLRLTAVYEPRSCSRSGSTAATSSTEEIQSAGDLPPTCRAFRFDYSQADADQPAVTVTDPAHRATRYELSKPLASGDPTSAVSLLLRTVDPDGAATSYGYGTCTGAASGQLCSITDRRGNATRLTYAGNSADPVGSPARVASTTDRRGSRTDYTYDTSPASSPTTPLTRTTVRASNDRPASPTDANRSTVTADGAPSAAETATPTHTAVYDLIDSAARTGQLEEFTGNATSAASDPADRLRLTEFTWDTPGHSCTRGAVGDPNGEADNNLCELVRRAAAHEPAAQRTPASANDEQTRYLYTREGLLLRERRTLTRTVSADGKSSTPTSTLDTTTGYTTQYLRASDNPPTVSEDRLAPGGEFSPDGYNDPPADTLFAVTDRTQSQTPRGNQAPAAGGDTTPGFADYLSEYTVDNDPAVAVSTFRPGESYCTSRADRAPVNSSPVPTGNTGLLCQSRAPSSTTDRAARTIGRATYDSFGQKTSATSPKAIATTDASMTPPSTRYRYLPDTATDISGTVTAGGWLRDVQDVTATTVAPSSADYRPAADHFVAFDYDAAGNTVRTWDRDATAGRGRDSFPGALTGRPGTEQGANRTGTLPAPHAAVAVYHNTDPTKGAGASQADYAEPWRYQRASATPNGDRTETGVDANGNAVRLTPPRGTAAHNDTFDVTSSYDAGDLSVRTATPLQRAANTSTRTAYDAYGNKVATVAPDQAGEPAGRHASVWRYDAVNRATTTLTGRGVATAAGTGSTCRPGTAADAPLIADRVLCQSTTGYDRLDNGVRTGDADGAVRTAEFDAVHRAVRQLAPRNTPGTPDLVTAMTYDPDGRVLDLCRPRQSAPATSPQEGGGGGCDSNSRYASHTRYDLQGLPVQVRTNRDAGTTLSTGTAYDADGNPTLVRDARGTATNPGTDGSTPFDSTSDYDLQGRLTSSTAPRAGTSRYLYSPAGDTLGVAAPGAATDNPAGASDADKAQRITGYTYDPSHRIVDTVSALQLSAFTPEQLSARTADALTDVDTVSPDKPRYDPKQTNLRSRTAYDADGHTVSTYSPKAFATPTGADGTSGGTGTAALLADPDARFKRTTTYDRDGRPSGQLSPRSQGEGTYADPTGVVTPASAGQCSRADGYPTDVLVCRTAVDYDPLGNLTRVALPSGENDARGSDGVDASRTLTYDYTDDNLLQTVTAPDPSSGAASNTRIPVQRTTFDGTGRPAATTDALERTTTTQYTADGLVASTTSPAGTDSKLTHTSEYAYNADGQPLEVATARPSSHDTLLDLTRYYDDGLVRETSTGGIRGATSDSKATGELTTRYSYDGAGNPTQTYSPEAVAARDNGPDASASNPAGVAVTNSYTPDNLLERSTQPVRVTAAGVQQTRVTSYGYDNAGRKTSAAVSLTGTNATTPTTQTFGYFPTGLLASQTGRNSERITHAYDADGRQTRVTDSTSPDGAVTGSYYLDGLPRQVSARARSTSYGYDGAGSLTARTVDANGQRQPATAYDRNDAGLPLTMTDIGGRTGWAYDRVGKPVRETRPTSQTQTFDYDTDDLLRATSVTRKGGELLSSWRYTHDELGRILTQTYSGSAAATTVDLAASSGSGPKGAEPAPTDPVAYRTSYDTAGRVASFTDARGTRTLTFDRNNNRTAYGTSGQKDPSSWTYRADDSIDSSTTPTNPGAADPGSQSTRTYGYAAFGGVTDDGCAAYDYDGFDRVSKIGRSGTVNPTDTAALATGGGCVKPDSTYSYDGLDRQTTIRRATAPGGPATSTTSLDYDGWDDAVLHQATSPLSGGTPSVDLSFVLDASGAAKTAQPTGGTTADATEYLAGDGTRSTGLVTGSDGAARCLARYDAYGNPDGNRAAAAPSGSCASGSSANDIFYRASRKDTATGQYALGSRTYDPVKGTFLTPDSYRTGGSAANTGLGVDPLTRNSYSYVNGDPLNQIDPSGHDPIDASVYKRAGSEHSVNYNPKPRARQRSRWLKAYDAVAGAGAGVVHVASDTAGFVQRYSPGGQVLDLVGLQDDLDRTREGLEDSFVDVQRDKLGVDTEGLAYKIGDKGTQIGLAVAPIGGAVGALAKAPRALKALGRARQAAREVGQLARNALRRKTPAAAAEAGRGALNLPFRNPELRSQVGDVVRHVDEFGAPPPGVAQGGLKGFPQGTYGNKSGALPQRDVGYYRESDIWQSGNGVKRGADRLIFGRDGEVWFTPNHYDSFVQIR